MSDSLPPIVNKTKIIRVRRIKGGSLFKLVLIGTATVFGPLILFFGILAYFGANTVTVSGEHVTGIKGLLTSFILAPIFVGILTLFAGVAGYVGIRIWGHFRPIEVEYVPPEDELA